MILWVDFFRVTEVLLSSSVWIPISTSWWSCFGRHLGLDGFIFHVNRFFFTSVFSSIRIISTVLHSNDIVPISKYVITYLRERSSALCFSAFVIALSLLWAFVNVSSILCTALRIFSFILCTQALDLVSIKHFAFKPLIVCWIDGTKYILKYKYKYRKIKYVFTSCLWLLGLNEKFVCDFNNGITMQGTILLQLQLSPTEDKVIDL